MPALRLVAGVRRAGSRAVVLGVAGAALLPLTFVITGALRPAGLPPPRGFELVPPGPTLDAFRRLPELLPVTEYLRNSVAVVGVAVPVSVLVASLAGFGIRLLPGPLRRAAVAVCLGTLLVPASALWTTRFELYRLTDTLDSFVPLVATALVATSPFNVLLFVWSFSLIPDSQLEAARLEGASAWATWRRLLLPQARPAVLAVTVLSFTAHWGNFMEPLLYVRRQELFTLALGMRVLQVLNPTDFPLLMAAALAFSLPAAAALLLAQRLFLDDPLAPLGRPREEV